MQFKRFDVQKVQKVDVEHNEPFELIEPLKLFKQQITTSKTFLSPV